jgi:hypothetical protein
MSSIGCSSSFARSNGTYEIHPIDDTSFNVDYKYMDTKKVKEGYVDITGKRRAIVKLVPTKQAKNQHAGVNYIHSLGAYIVRQMVAKFPQMLVTIHDAFGMPIHLVPEFK